MATFRVPSNTTKGKFYNVTLRNSGASYTCECTGFKQRGQCSHGDGVLADPKGYAASAEAVQRPLPRASYGTLPLPMLSKPLTDKIVFGGDRHSAEVKYDGHRMCAEVIQNVSVAAWSRTGIDCMRKLDRGLVENLKKLPTGIYDGELLVPGEGTYSSDVSNLDNKNKLVFMVFDVLHILDSDVTKESQRSRRKMLDLIFDKIGASLMRIELSPEWIINSREQLMDIAEEIWMRAGEGLIIKDRAARYEPGKRTSHFMKLKECDHAVLEVIGFCPSGGEIVDRGPCGTVVLMDDEGMYTVVKTLNDEELARLNRLSGSPVIDKIKLGGRTVTFNTNHPDVGRKLHIEFQKKTPDGSYRHPRWDRWDS